MNKLFCSLIDLDYYFKFYAKVLKLILYFIKHLFYFIIAIFIFI